MPTRVRSGSGDAEDVREKINQTVVDLHHNPRAFRNAHTRSQWEHLWRCPRYPSAQPPESEKKTGATKTRISRTRVVALERCGLIEFIDKEQDVVNDGAVAREHLVAANVKIRSCLYSHRKAAIHVVASGFDGVTGRRLKHRVRCAGAPGLWKFQRLRQIVRGAFLGAIVDPL